MAPKRCLPTLRCPATFEAWQDEKTWEVLKPQETLVDADGAKVKPHSVATFEAPIRLAQSSTVTNAAITKS